MRKQFRTIYDGDTFIDGIEFDTLEEAQHCAYSILDSWMESCPEEEWDYMIYNCAVWVEQYCEDASDWVECWYPGDAALKTIGWVEKGSEFYLD